MLLLYKLSVSPKLQGYLTNNGDVNLKRLGTLVGQIGQIEDWLLAAKCHADDRERRRRDESERQRGLDRLGRMDASAEQERAAHRDQLQAQQAQPAVHGHGSGGGVALGRAGRVLARLSGTSAEAAAGAAAGGACSPSSELRG